MPADLLEIRHALAAELDEPTGGWLVQCPRAFVGDHHRYGAVLWRLEPHEHTRGVWLPVLDDDGTRGAVLGLLERLGLQVTLTAYNTDRVDRCECCVSEPHGDLLVRQIGATLGEALARARVALASLEVPDAR